jgi:hypothetical protein
VPTGGGVTTPPGAAPGGGQPPIARAPAPAAPAAAQARPARTGGLDPIDVARAVASLGSFSLGVGLLLRRRTT